VAKELSIPSLTSYQRIVVAVATSAHAHLDVFSRQQFLVIMTGVLATTVRVTQQSCFRATMRQRHLERTLDEGGLLAFAHRSTDNLAGEECHHRCHVQPAMRHSDVGKIRHLFLVGTSGLFVALALYRPQSVLAHQAGNALATARDALRAQFMIDPVTAIRYSDFLGRPRGYGPATACCVSSASWRDALATYSAYYAICPALDISALPGTQRVGCR